MISFSNSMLSRNQPRIPLCRDGLGRSWRARWEVPLAGFSIPRDLRRDSLCIISRPVNRMAITNRIKASLKRVLVGRPPDPRVEWPRVLDGRVQIGQDTRLEQATLRAHDPAGCSLTIGSESSVEAVIAFEKANAQIRIGSRTH